MPRFQLVSHAQNRSGPELTASQAAELLGRVGLHFGRAPAPVHHASAEPRLRHARALLQLQQRFGEVDHVRRRRATTASAAALLAPPGDEAEAWVLVVRGQISVQLPLGCGWLRCTWEPLDWFTRPAGLRAVPDAAEDEEPVEWLVLSRHLRPARPVLASGLRQSLLRSPVLPLLRLSSPSLAGVPA